MRLVNLIRNGCWCSKRTFIEEKKVSSGSKYNHIPMDFDEFIIIETIHRCNKCGKEFKKIRKELQW